MDKAKDQARGHLLTEDGKIFKIPERCTTMKDISNWVNEHFGANVDIHISEMEVYFPEIDKTVKFLETEEGILISTKTLTEEEFQKVARLYPWIRECINN